MPITKEQLDQFIKAFGGVEDDAGPSAQAQAEAEAKAKAETEARAKAEAEEKAEAERKKAEAEKAETEKANAKKEEDRKTVDELQAKLEEEKLSSLKAAVAGKFISKGFVEDQVNKITDFFDYDKLRNQDGEVDEEKLNTLVEDISSMPLRVPPRSNTKTSFAAADNGIGKYLQN